VRFRRFLTWLWVAILVAILLLWLRDPTLLSEGRVEAAVGAWGALAFPVFVVIALARGALLVPSTPVVLAGAALFPDFLVWVLLVTMVGILLSAALLYRFPGFAGYDELLAAKHPEKLEKLRHQLAKPWAMWLVAGWAFFPAVPTDLICYAAGLVRMPFRRMMLGIIIGELPLVTAYLFFGRWLAEYLPF
jgi:uncharacterized membrane protein YdjX (TVP38/TMEM64 family)